MTSSLQCTTSSMTSSSLMLLMVLSSSSYMSSWPEKTLVGAVQSLGQQIQTMVVSSSSRASCLMQATSSLKMRVKPCSQSLGTELVRPAWRETTDSYLPCWLQSRLCAGVK